MNFKLDNFDVPRNPNLSVQPVTTPDNGFLFSSFKLVVYVAPNTENAEDSSDITVFHNKSEEIIGIACDLDWSTSREFAVLDNGSLNVWDVDQKMPIKGHKLHKNSGYNSEKCLCYFKKKQILSVDNNATVVYCVSSNTYKLYETINVFKTKLITILKVAPFDDTMIAAANKSGLIIIISLKTMSPISKFRGHDFELCSLEWMPAFYTHSNMNTNIDRQEMAEPIKQKPTRSRKPQTEPEVDDSDIFDIYSYDQLETEFGTMRDKKPTFNDNEEAEINRLKELRTSYTDFNFNEACDNLKDFIKSSEEEPNVSILACNSKSLYDIPDSAKSLQESQECNVSGFSNDDNDQQNLSNDSNPDCDKLKDFILVNKDDIETECNQILASSTKDGLIWLWDVKRNKAIEKVIFTPDKKKDSNVYKFYDIIWMSAEKMYVFHNSYVIEYSVNIYCSDQKPKFEVRNKFHLTQSVTYFRLNKVVQDNIFWGLASKQIICVQLVEIENDIQTTIIKQYDTLSSKNYMIKQNPCDPNLLAIACSDKRIALWNCSILEKNKFQFSAYFTQKVQSSVNCIDWHSEKDYLIAFATREGRVGVLNTNRYSNVPTVFAPLTNGVIYVIKWGHVIITGVKKEVLFVCANNKLFYYKVNSADSDAVEITGIQNVSSVHTSDEYLFVGTRDGHVQILDLANEFTKIWSASISKAYITKFDSYDNELAAACEGSEIAIIDLKDPNNFKMKYLLGHEKNVNSVAWNKKPDMLLVSGGGDRKVKVWDTKNSVCIATCAQVSPIYYAIFSPFDENTIMVVGEYITLKFIDYKNIKNEMSNATDKIDTKNNAKFELAQLNNVHRPISKSASRKNRKVNKRSIEIDNIDKNEESSAKNDDIEEIVQELESVCLNSKTITKKVEAKLTNATILYLTNKELNIEPLECLKHLLKMNPIDQGDRRNYQYRKLFMDDLTVKELLADELRNHKNSKTESIGNVIIPQLTNELKQELLLKIETKSLTSIHVSVAPTISYEFWKICSSAYALQLIENNDILNAIPYFLAVHDINSAINTLLETHFYREAWIIAKIRKLNDDPIFERISTKWAEYLDSCGNFESAALIWACIEKYNLASEALKKRKRTNSDIDKIIQTLESNSKESQ